MSMPAGWYPDPFSNSGYVRWWDGERWGASTAARVDAQGQPTSPPPLGPMPKAQAGWGTATDSGSVVLASWGSRAIARILDGFIVGVVMVPLVAWLLWPSINDFMAAIPADGSAPSDQSLKDLQAAVVGMSLTLTAVSAAISFVYQVPQNVRWGRTVGKRVVGIRIRPRVADGSLTWGQATIRWAVDAAFSAISPLLNLLDYLWPLWDKPWRQAIHDKAAKTIVVRIDRTSTPL